MQHRRAERTVADDKFERSAGARVADDTERALGRRDERGEGIVDIADRVHHAEIDNAVDVRRHVDRGDEAADRTGADDDGDRADRLQEIVLDVAGNFGRG